jgi:formylglycine-generating enzyme required for sulfatase activity
MLARLATALVLISVPASAVGQPPAEMVHVPAGVLSMGADDGEAAERPVHRVWVSSFLIDRLETTNAQFRRFVERTAHVTDREREGWGWHRDLRWHRREGADWRHPRGAGSSIDELDRHPVVQVSWHDARAYCGWRGKRLPSEAEWERAARGEGARRYAWGDESPRAGGISRASYGTHECCSAGDADGYRFTAPVGSGAHPSACSTSPATSGSGSRTASKPTSTRAHRSVTR